jgi:predicted secreted acid phosphatase
VAVTNRVESRCKATRENQEAEQVATDAVLCAPENTPPEKETRFRAIREGTAVKGLGPLEVALYVGDQVTDCAGQTQASYDREKFGQSCIALPNPMYGTWANNSYR